MLTEKPPADSPKMVTLGIAAERADVRLNPLQRGDLVHDAVVADVPPRSPRSAPDARRSRNGPGDS